MVIIQNVACQAPMITTSKTFLYTQITGCLKPDLAAEARDDRETPECPPLT